jgi:hypothetical protein
MLRPYSILPTAARGSYLLAASTHSASDIK